MSKLRRILIDCSFVDFTSQPTGIPRVVLKYIEIGYLWGQLNGIEVVPVLPTSDGLFICRPVPGRGAPAYVLAAAQASSDRHPVPNSGALSDTQWAAVSDELRRLLLGLREVAQRLEGSAGTDQIVQQAGGAGTCEKQRLTQGVRITPGPQDMLFCPAYWHDIPAERYQGYSNAGAKIVILVHDILPIIFPRFYNAPWCHEFKRNVIAVCKVADILCAVSDYTRKCLGELIQRERLASVPLMTAYNGFEALITKDGVETQAQHSFLPQSALLTDRSAMGRYYLMVGSIEPKKGHRPVIECFEAMWRGGLASRLVIIGRRGWLEADAVAAIETSPFYRTRLFWFSGIDDFELGRSYEGARALVFASLGEGFGLPMIEAAAHGLPIIAYDTPIVREVLGTAARLFTTASDLVTLVAEMERDQPYAEAASAAEQVAWPSWQDYTPRVYDTLRDFFDGATALPETVPLFAALSGTER